MVESRRIRGDSLGPKLAPALPHHHEQRGGDRGGHQRERDAHARPSAARMVLRSKRTSRSRGLREVLAERCASRKDVPPLDVSRRVVIVDGAGKVVPEREERLRIEAFGRRRSWRGKGELQRETFFSLRETAAAIAERGNLAELLPVGEARLDVNELPALALGLESREDLDPISLEELPRRLHARLVEPVKRGDGGGRPAHADLSRAVHLEENLLLVLVGDAAGAARRSSRTPAFIPVILA
jgi:hypothetical protein